MLATQTMAEGSEKILVSSGTAHNDGVQMDYEELQGYQMQNKRLKSNSAASIPSGSQTLPTSNKFAVLAALFEEEASQQQESASEQPVQFRRQSNDSKSDSVRHNKRTIDESELKNSVNNAMEKKLVKQPPIVILQKPKDYIVFVANLKDMCKEKFECKYQSKILTIHTYLPTDYEMLVESLDELGTRFYTHTRHKTYNLVLKNLPLCNPNLIAW